MRISEPCDTCRTCGTVTSVLVSDLEEWPDGPVLIQQRLERIPHTLRACNAIQQWAREEWPASVWRTPRA